jgi:hypothetical protein
LCVGFGVVNAFKAIVCSVAVSLQGCPELFVWPHVAARIATANATFIEQQQRTVTILETNRLLFVVGFYAIVRNDHHPIFLDATVTQRYCGIGHSGFVTATHPSTLGSLVL